MKPESREQLDFKLSKMVMRQKREARDIEIRQHTRTLLEEVGFFDMKISDLAKRCKISIGTLYSHYACKEDLLIALAIDGEVARFTNLQDSLLVGETPIETFMACAMTCMKSSCHDRISAEAAHLAMSPSIWKRASPHMHLRMREADEKVWTVFHTLLKRGVESGDLHIQGAVAERLEQMNVGAWSLSMGIDVISFSQSSEEGATSDLIGEWQHLYKENLIRFLQGWGWQEPNPLAVYDRIQNKLPGGQQPPATEK